MSSRPVSQNTRDHVSTTHAQMPRDTFQGHVRPKSLSMSVHNIYFEKGPGKKGLGFSVVGGIDSPKEDWVTEFLEIFVTERLRKNYIRMGTSINHQPQKDLLSSSLTRIKKLHYALVPVNWGVVFSLSSHKITLLSKVL